MQHTALQSIISNRIPYTPVVRPDSVKFGQLTLLIFPSPLLGATDDQNDLSLMVRVEYGAFSAVLTGDSGIDELNSLIQAGRAAPATVLKAAHHGARDGVTPLWLFRLHPPVVVISVGEGNMYGHPSPAAMRYYLAGGRKVYRTDRQGHVSICAGRSGNYRVLTSFDGDSSGAGAERRTGGLEACPGLH